MKKVLKDQLTDEDLVLRMALLSMNHPVVNQLVKQKYNNDVRHAFTRWKELPTYRNLLELLHIYSVKVNKKEYFVREQDSNWSFS